LRIDGLADRVEVVTHDERFRGWVSASSE
jgi:hypothetical protein